MKSRFFTRKWTIALFGLGLAANLLRVLVAADSMPLDHLLSFAVGIFLGPAFFAAVLAGIPAWIVRLFGLRRKFPTEIAFTIIFTLLSLLPLFNILVGASS